LAGLALGLSAGTKYSTLIPAIVSAAYLVTIGPSPRFASAWRTLAAAAAGGGFWYVRNLLATGNPLFPLPITVAGHQLLPTNISVSTLPEGTLLRAFLTNPTTPGVVARLFLVGTGLFTLLVLILVPLVAKTHRPTSPGLPFLWTLAIIFALLYATTPTTAPYGGGAWDIAPAFRYILGPVVLATLWGVARIPPRWTLAAATPSLVYDLLGMLNPDGRPDLVVNWEDCLWTTLVVAGVVAVVWLLKVLKEHSSKLLRLATLSTTALVALSVLVAATANAVGQPKVSSLVADVGGAQGAVVAIYHVQDIREVLGPTFEVWNINSIGQGRQGAQTDPVDPVTISASLAQLNPAIVVIGQGTRLDQFGKLEPGANWTLVGTIGPPQVAARVYLTHNHPGE
jgi:hypothetical protein